MEFGKVLIDYSYGETYNYFDVHFCFGDMMDYTSFILLLKHS
jgi:hypothetical protein